MSSTVAAQGACRLVGSGPLVVGQQVPTIVARVVGIALES
jgi:hypothetical protein